MKKVQLGSSGLQVSVACLGTMMMGSTNTEEESIAQLDYFMEKGGNFIDTAEMYPVPIKKEYIGKSEEFIGRWMKAKNCRKDVILATKVSGPTTFNYVSGNRTVPFDEGAGVANLTPKDINEALEASLRRLQTDYIDLYQIHWPSRYAPIFGSKQYRPEKIRDCVTFEEQVKAVGELVKSGKIKYWGLSNETAYGVTMFCETAKKLGVPLPITIQNDYSICDRGFDMETAEACNAYNVKLLPYGVLAGGFLSGKYLNGAKPAGARHSKHAEFQSRYAAKPVEEALIKYKEVADRKGLSLTHLAVAWVASRWHLGSCITGQTSVPQLEEYMAAFDVTLDEETLKEVDRIHKENRCPQWED